jgi:hypothetical protein
MTDQPKPESELLPCPFCGRAARAGGDDGLWYVLCAGEDCHAAVGEGYDRDAMPDHRYYSEDAAVAAWNRRAAVARNAPALGFSQWQDKLAFAICEELCDQLNAGVNETRELAARTVASTRVTEVLRAHPPAIAAIYSSLDTEDCKRIDREWAKMRGYIIPADGTSTLHQCAHPPGAAGWQPIETAPKDGSYVLVGWKGSPAVNRLHFRNGDWRDAGSNIFRTPTDWIPLPAPPSRDTQEENMKEPSR